MPRLAWSIAVVMILPALSGCAAIDNLVQGVIGPQADVQYTPLATGEGVWNTDSRFRVVAAAAEPVTVRVELIPIEGGETRTFTSGTGDLQQTEVGYETDFTVDLPDGTWDVVYYVDEREWDRFGPVQVDTSAPKPEEPIETLVNAPEGSYTFDEVTVEDGADFLLRNLDTGAILSRELPFTVTELADGLHSFLLRWEDQAGNVYEVAVHVRVGDAVNLDPEDGTYSFGVIARYTREAVLWDLSRMDEYLMPAEASAELEGAYMGEGYGITPDDPTVQQVVADTVTADMNTMEAAKALYIWMFENLEYDDHRLASNTLMTPHQVINDAEDPDAEAPSSSDPDAADDDEDGLADDGTGNGVRGGVCRDLAGTYISLLRAAGIPARIVSGYLAGDVNGFHAWVEFYAGSVGGQSPWVPVDVSPIDDEYSSDADGDGVPDGMSTLLQSFAVSLPEYLPLRHVPDGDEVAGWSTALSVYFEFSEEAPELEFEKSINIEFQDPKVLCLNVETLARQVVNPSGGDETGENCPDNAFGHPDGRFLANFVARAEQKIDYGIDLKDPGQDACITAEVAFPDHATGIDAASTPYIPYGWAYQTQERGKLVSEHEPEGGNCD